jgi:hypothetical protein
MKGRKARVTDAERLAGAILNLRQYPSSMTTQEIAELWDEVENHDTYGGASLEWVYLIRQAKTLGYTDTLFRAVVRHIRKRTRVAVQNGAGA